MALYGQKPLDPLPAPPRSAGVGDRPARRRRRLREGAGRRAPGRRQARAGQQGAAPSAAPAAVARAAPKRANTTRIRRRCKPAVDSGPAQPLYWGATIGSHLTGDQAPWDMNAVSQVRRRGRASRPRWSSSSSPSPSAAARGCSFYSFPTDADGQTSAATARSRSSAGARRRSPPSLNQPDFQLSDVIAGRYDAYIAQFAAEAARLGPPLLPPLQLGDERQLVPLGRGRQRQRAPASTSPPGATSTTSSPPPAPPTSPGSGARSSTRAAR